MNIQYYTLTATHNAPNTVSPYKSFSNLTYTKVITESQFLIASLISRGATDVRITFEKVG